MALCLMLRLFIFFFQAEDGIRDFHVTGVQTCALPIWSTLLDAVQLDRVQECGPFEGFSDEWPFNTTQQIFGVAVRSEERRVGKECRGRWRKSQHKRKKTTEKYDYEKESNTCMSRNENT